MEFLQQNIREMGVRVKVWLAEPQVFSSILLVLVALTAFGLGRQSAGQVVQEAAVGTALETKSEVEGERRNSESTARPTGTPSTYYVASKNGEVYHLPHCAGAKRISEANKITFKTKEEAEAAGLRPAANCKGI
jgi:hypothetical protein